jgi:hypothetical protein
MKNLDKSVQEQAELFKREIEEMAKRKDFSDRVRKKPLDELERMREERWKAFSEFDIRQMEKKDNNKDETFQYGTGLF